MGRVLTFADPEVVRLAKNVFVPVAGDDWYQRRRNDAEGKFFRKVADQGPRQGAGGSTRQGIYIFTASGKLLNYRNHSDPEVMKQVIRQGLLEWNNLPREEKEPGGIKVAETFQPDKTYHREPPKGGLVLTVYTRILDKTRKGDYCQGSCSNPGGERAARDHMWLTEEEWKSLIPASAKIGDGLALPERLVQRIVRFHLVDNTRGEPAAWNRDQIRAAKINLVIDEVNDSGLTMRLEGACLMSAAADPTKATVGFDVALRGTIHYDAAKKLIDRFDVVALGQHWGSGPYTGIARPGRTPLGIVFELAGNSPADRVPPQGSRWLPGYMQAER